MRLSYMKISVVLLQILLFGGCMPRPELPPIPIQGAPGERLYQRAESKFQSREFSDSVQLFQDYINLYPASPLVPPAYLKIGTIYLAQERYTQAREAFQTLIDKLPGNRFIPDAQLGILTTYYHEGKYEILLKNAAELEDETLPTNILQRKYALLGDTYQATGRSYQSVAAYIKVYQTTDSEVEKQNIRTRLERPAADLSTIEIQEILSSLQAADLKAYFEYLLGIQYAKSDQYEDAVRQLNHFIETYPDHEKVTDARQFLDNLMQISEYDRMTIGCLLPLSGRYKAFGSRALKGIELALDRFSRQFPETDIRLLIQDTKGNPDTAAALVNELAEKKVAAIIGPIITAHAAAEAAQSHRIPIITMTQKEGVTKVGDYVFRNFLTPEMQIQTIVSFAIEYLGLQKFAILYPDETYGRMHMNLFWDKILSLGGEIRGVEAYDPHQTDFSVPIKKLVGLYYEIPEELKKQTEEGLPGADPHASKPEEPKAIVDFDALFIPDGPEKTGLILPQLTYYDVVDTYLLGTNLWHSDKLIQMAGKQAQGAIMPEIFFAESTKEVVVDFVRNFTAIYEEKPGFIEAIAYDTARLLFQTISSQELTFRNSIKNRLVNLYEFQGVTGKTTFRPDGEASKELFMLQINGSQFTELSYE